MNFNIMFPLLLLSYYFINIAIIFAIIIIDIITITIGSLDVLKSMETWKMNLYTNISI